MFYYIAVFVLAASAPAVFVLAVFLLTGLRDKGTMAQPPASSAKVKFLVFFPLRDNETKAGPPASTKVKFLMFFPLRQIQSNQNSSEQV